MKAYNRMEQSEENKVQVAHTTHIIAHTRIQPNNGDKKYVSLSLTLSHTSQVQCRVDLKETVFSCFRKDGDKTNDSQTMA